MSIHYNDYYCPKKYGGNRFYIVHTCWPDLIVIHDKPSLKICGVVFVKYLNKYINFLINENALFALFDDIRIVIEDMGFWNNGAFIGNLLSAIVFKYNTNILFFYLKGMENKYKKNCVVLQLN
jgi:hypothetical protein